MTGETLGGSSLDKPNRRQTVEDLVFFGDMSIVNTNYETYLPKKTQEIADNADNPTLVFVARKFGEDGYLIDIYKHGVTVGYVDVDFNTLSGFDSYPCDLWVFDGEENIRLNDAPMLIEDALELAALELSE